MKKLLSIMLSFVMAAVLLTGCGDKDAEKNSSFFKEMAKLQDIQTGTSELELAVDVKGSAVSKDTDIPEQLKNGDNLALKIKMEATAESASKVALKVSAQYGGNDNVEITTIVIDGTKLYVNVGAIVDFIKSIDESMASQVELYLGQLGISNYVSVDLKQFYEKAGMKSFDISPHVDSIKKIMNSIFTHLDQSFADIQGHDGDDYTLTVGVDNADKTADAVVRFCDVEFFKQLYTDLMDLNISIVGADTQPGKQFAEQKKDTTQVEDAAAQVKAHKEDIANTLKDLNMNIVSKIHVTGDEGSREAKLTVDTGEFKSTEEDVTGKITLTGTIKEGKASIKDIIPTEGVVDLTAMLNAMMNQVNVTGAAGQGIQ